MLPPIRFSYKTADMYLGGPAPRAPNSRHWLGTDDAGKDTLAHLIYGFQYRSVWSLADHNQRSIGVAVGALQGYFEE